MPWREACRLYFKDRSDLAIFAKLPSKLAAYRDHRVNLKGEDALLLVSELKKCPTRPTMGFVPVKTVDRQLHRTRQLHQPFFGNASHDFDPAH